MIVLIICICVALIAIALIVISGFQDNEGMGTLGFVILLIDGIMGFGVLCIAYPATTTEIQQEFYYAKTHSTVLIETPTKYETFTDAHTFNIISDSSKVFLHTDYNVYGGEVRSYLVIK